MLVLDKLHMYLSKVIANGCSFESSLFGFLTTACLSVQSDAGKFPVELQFRQVIV